MSYKSGTRKTFTPLPHHDNTTIRVFVGGQAEHWLPIRILEYSIRTRTEWPVEFRRLMDCPITVPEPADPSNRPATSFSFQRFLPPEWCGFHGRAIYLDSDMIVLHDIADLWNSPFPLSAKVLTAPGWQSAVMLQDCSCGWRIGELVGRLDRGESTYRNMMNLTGFPAVAQLIDANWNCHDRMKDFQQRLEREQAKLVHYTRMDTQPWLRGGHSQANLWLGELSAALASGFITAGEVMRQIEMKHVRPSLSVNAGVYPPPYRDEDFQFPNDRRAA